MKKPKWGLRRGLAVLLASLFVLSMYATGIDPRTMKPVYVPRDPHEKALQRALIQYRNPKNHALVREALRKAGRADLIGWGPRCLVLPAKKRERGQARKSP